MYSLNCRGKLLIIDKPIVMGIINATPDSFFTGSRKSSLTEVLQQAEKMLFEGALILDIGGQSTRPGSENVGVDEELSRVMPAIEAVRKFFPDATLSIDTYHGKVAKEAVDAGVDLVNDVSGGNFDPELLPTIVGLKVPYVLSYSAGSFSQMHQRPDYKNIVLQTFDQLNFKIHELRSAGITDLVVDPGFGFAKSIQDNFEVLRDLNFLNHLGVPLLAGLSRKATIYRTLNITPEEALNGSTVMHTIALLNGASILRVHDVREAVEACTLFDAYTNK